MVARNRSGKKTGPGRLRKTARTSARTRISTSAIAKSWMLSQNAATMSGKAFVKTVALKNETWTSAQPGAFTVIHTRIPKTTTVLTSATSVDRRAVRGRPRARSGPPGGPTASMPPVSSGPPRSDIRGGDAVRLRPEDRGRRLVGEPLLRDLVQAAVRLHRRDRPVDARGERAALREDGAEVLGSRPGLDRELAHDVRERVALGVRDLRRGDVEGGRQVDHEGVDLLRLEGRDRVVVRRVDRRLGGRPVSYTHLRAHETDSY